LHRPAAPPKASRATSGQNLARGELQIALATLARRLPGLQLAVPPEDPRFMNEQGIYRGHELPVSW
jgi:cytochrome P450